MVESLDENVGRVLAKIDEVGIAERTVVLFTSDNGGYINSDRLHPKLTVTSNAPLRSGKGSCYEGGIRVPLMIRWPGQTAGGSETDVPVTSCDLFPTILAMLDQEVDSNLVLDGVDLTGLLQDLTAERPTRPLYFHYPHYYPTTSPVSAVRSGDWKLLEFFEESRVELYNLSDDLGEQRNLATVDPGRTEDLQQQLQQWRSEVDAQLPEPNPARQSAK
jgi:arylsulfatase A-like enzyme